MEKTPHPLKNFKEKKKKAQSKAQFVKTPGRNTSL